MEPETLTVIVFGILLALTMLPGAPKRAVEPNAAEFADRGEPDALQPSLDGIAGR